MQVTEADSRIRPVLHSRGQLASVCQTGGRNQSGGQRRILRLKLPPEPLFGHRLDQSARISRRCV